jgi:hypothetical protein
MSGWLRWRLNQADRLVGGDDAVPVIDDTRCRRGDTRSVSLAY